MDSLSSEISLMFGALASNELKKSNEREKVWKQRRPLHVAEMNMDRSVLREHLQGIWLFTWNCSQRGIHFQHGRGHAGHAFAKRNAIKCVFVYA